MPIPKDFTKKEAKKLKRCEDDLKGKKGINKYAICKSSIRKSRKTAVGNKLNKSKKRKA